MMTADKVLMGICVVAAAIGAAVLSLHTQGIEPPLWVIWAGTVAAIVAAFCALALLGRFVFIYRRY